MGRRGKKSNEKRIIALSIVIVVLALIFACIAWVSTVLNGIKEDINGGQGDGSEVTIEIPSGSNVEDVLLLLQEKGIVEDGFFNSLAFRLKADEAGLGLKLQAGTFSIPNDASYQEIFDLITVAPEYRETVTITFPEGCEVSDVIELFLKNGIGTAEGFALAVDYDYGYSYLPEPGTASRLEGFLYPDTYQFFADATEVEVFAKMIKQFDSKIKASGISEERLYDALILASIIQKESGKPEDFTMISSVFHNRIDIGMKLQSDAATSYPIPKEERLPSCTYEQLNTDTPYNVYLHEGLTPTPICNPRIEAIVASCQPAESEYFYFIGYIDETGKQVTVFAKTYSEHLKNVDKYL